MRGCAMGWFVLALLVTAGPASAWVGEEELPGPVAKLRTQFRAEYEKGMAPITAKCRQSLETQLKAATIRRSGPDINLMKELIRMLNAGQSLDDDRVRTVSSKVPREVQLTCHSYQGERARLEAGLSRKHVAELGRAAQTLKAAGDADGAAVAAREAADLTAGEYNAWGAPSWLTRRIAGTAWEWMERTFRFMADGTVEGRSQATWKQIGPQSLRLRVAPTEDRPHPIEVKIAFIEDFHRFEATDAQKEVTYGRRVRRN